MKILYCNVFICAIALCSLLTSCGYRLSGSEEKVSSRVSIPYVKGDLDGQLTAAIITKFSTSSRWQYVQDAADLVLDIEILESDRHYIGYKYDRVKSTAELINRLIPNEGRRTLKVKLQLLDAKKEHTVYGPYEIEAFADYDFVNFDTYKDLAFVNQEGVAESVLSFSLGQLDSEEGGKEAVQAAVYQNLAEKILIGLDQL